MCLAATQEAVRHRAEELPRISRRGFLAAGAGAALGAALSTRTALASPPPGRGTRDRIQDLTHVFRDGFPVYGFSNPTRENLVTIPTDGFYANRWTFPEHAGTHVDAPGHFALGNRLADQLPPEELLVPIAVVDISDRAATDPDAQVTVDDLIRFERGHGRIPRRALVCMHSGWERFVDDQEAYRGTDAEGVFHFPGFSLEAALWLLEHRDIAGIGVDTLSLDFGPSASFDVHFAVLGAERYGVENLANLATIPPRGATAFVGLVPWEEGSGGPARVIARW